MALLHGLEVLQAKLGRDREDVAHRIDAVLDVDHVRVLEAPRDLHDRVDLADVRKKLVSEPFAFGRPPHEPRDVDEVHVRGHDLLGVDHRVERGEARVGDDDDPDVRLDRAKRVVCRLGLRRRQRVEEGGLAHVGEADDADGERHGGGRLPRRRPHDNARGHGRALPTSGAVGQGAEAGFSPRATAGALIFSARRKKREPWRR
jgi:hypothetical protein